MALGISLPLGRGDAAPADARPSLWARLLRGLIAARRHDAALVVRREAPFLAAHR